MAAELEGFEGRKLGGYKLLEVVGHGGMAVVFRAESVRTKEIVAVKVMRPSLDSEPEFRHRIAREAKIAAKLRHPNIVRVRSIREHDGYFFLVMDYIDGPSLFGVERKHGPMRLKQAAPLINGVLAALAFAHGKKVIHRDLKPENVMISKDGQALLTDFGIAKPLEGTKLTKTGRAIGTPLYMSPEQVRGQSSIDIRTDIYSAGVLFYELLTGKVPFDGDDPVSIGYKHVHSAPILPSDLNTRLTANEDLFVLKAMEKERGDRYASAKEMTEALETVFRGEDLAFELQSPIRRQERKTWLGPTTKALGLTVCIGAGLVGAVYFQDGNLDRVAASLHQPWFGGEVIERDLLSEGKALLRQGHVDEALKLFAIERRKGALLAVPQKDLGIFLLEQGRRRTVKGQWAEAVRLFNAAYQFDATNADSCAELAKAYQAQGNHRLAAAFFGQTMKILEPERASDFAESCEQDYFSKLNRDELERIGIDMCEVGQRLQRKGHDERARDILRKSLHYKENQLQAHHTLALIYTSLGDTKAHDYHQKRYAELFEEGGE